MSKMITFKTEGFTAKLADTDDKAVREALAAQAGVTDRYLKLEPAISAAFGAPACYEKGTPQRKGLLAYLQERHPRAAVIAKLRAEQEAAQAKGQPELAHEKGGLAVIEENKRDVDVQNAVRAFKKYFEAGKAGKRERSEVSPREKAEGFVKSMERYYKEGSQWPAADQKFARSAADAIRALLGDDKLRVAEPRTVGEDSKKPGKVKVLSPEEIAAL